MSVTTPPPLDFIKSRLLPEVESGCHVWTYSLDKCGYGQVRYSGKIYKVHRLVYALTKGEPGPQMVCHTCDNRACANEEHLFLGTALDNTRDMYDKGRNRNVGKLGEAHHAASLTEDTVREIRRSPERGSAIARRLGVSASIVSDIRRRKTWRHVD